MQSPSVERLSRDWFAIAVLQPRPIFAALASDPESFPLGSGRNRCPSSAPLHRHDRHRPPLTSSYPSVEDPGASPCRRPGRARATAVSADALLRRTPDPRAMDSPHSSRAPTTWRDSHGSAQLGDDLPGADEGTPHIVRHLRGLAIRSPATAERSSGAPARPLGPAESGFRPTGSLLHDSAAHESLFSRNFRHKTLIGQGRCVRCQRRRIRGRRPPARPARAPPPHAAPAGCTPVIEAVQCEPVSESRAVATRAAARLACTDQRPFAGRPSKPPPLSCSLAAQLWRGLPRPARSRRALVCREGDCGARERRPANARAQ